MAQLSGYSNNHQHITGDFAEHLVMYCLSKRGYECAHVRHVGIDVIAAKDGKRLGISVKSRSRKPGMMDVSLTMNNSKKHVEHVRETCQHFRCEEHFAFVMDQNDTIKVILVPLSCIERHYVISEKSSQDWNTRKFEADPSAQVFELVWKG
jgi:Holliday junction resolvase-like predicted endonuclease